MTSLTPRPRLAVAMRDGERVSALELFFDLVFVLAVTQCAELMVHDTSARGLAQGLVVLSLLWWAWVGYAWLTSVVDPEDEAVRFAMFGSMAAMLIASLSVPEAFGGLATTFVVAYAVVRAGHIALFSIAGRDDPALRHSVAGLAISSSVGIAILGIGSALDGDARLVVWSAALLLDLAGPLVFDTRGWRLAPGHFAERHGLIMIVALGESIIAIGVGASGHVDGGVIVTAIGGIAIACAFWWAYFDVSAIAAARRLAEVEEVRERNVLARDAFSYLHLPMVAAVVLVALGIKTAIAHVGDPLGWVTASALCGGAALYLLAHVGLALRTLRTLSVQRVVAAAAALALIPLAHEVDAAATVFLVAGVLWALVAVEAHTHADARRSLRHAGPHH